MAELDLSFSAQCLWIFIAVYRIFSCGIRDLVFSPGIKPRPPAMRSCSLSHWTTRGVLMGFFPPPPLSYSLVVSNIVENTWHPCSHMCAEDRLLFGSIARYSIACFVLLKVTFLSVPLPNAADLLLCPSPALCAPELGRQSPRCRMPAWLTTQMHQTWLRPSGHSQTKRISTVKSWN